LFFDFETTTSGGSSILKKTKKQRDQEEPQRIEIESIKVSKQKNSFDDFWTPANEIIDADLPDDSNIVRIVMIRFYNANSYELTPSYGHYRILPFLFKTSRVHFDISQVEERIEKFKQSYYLTWRDYYAGVNHVEYFDIDLQSLETQDLVIGKEDIKRATFLYSKKDQGE
jgi:hypothetical protein